MIESKRSTGKNTDNHGFLMLVVAAALHRSDGHWLMQRRPLEKHHGGLWEFPGGKVEPSEMPEQALRRELLEELGITLDNATCRPVGFAEDHGDPSRSGIVILLYTIDRWVGSPRSLEGGALGWFSPAQIGELAKPPLDQQLAARLFAKD